MFFLRDFSGLICKGTRTVTFSYRSSGCQVDTILTHNSTSIAVSELKVNSVSMNNSLY